MKLLNNSVVTADVMRLWQGAGKEEPDVVKAGVPEYSCLLLRFYLHRDPALSFMKLLCLNGISGLFCPPESG